MKVSVNSVWEDTLAFLRAERALVVPVALGTIYLAAVLAIAVAALFPAGIAAPIVWAASLWGIVGQLALIDLALTPGQSVRDALRLGMRRLPLAILIYLMIFAALVLLSMPVALALMQAGYGSETWPKLMGNQVVLLKAIGELPSWASLYVLALMAIGCFIFVRLLLWKASLLSHGKPIEALKRSWQLTRGKFWALFALAVLAGLTMEIINWALGNALGATFLMIGRSLGSPLIALIVPALIVALVAAAFQTVTTLFLAIFYRRAAAA